MDGGGLIAKKVAADIYNLLEKGEKMAPDTEVLCDFKDIVSALENKETNRILVQGQEERSDSEGYEVEEEPALLIKK